MNFRFFAVLCCLAIPIVSLLAQPYTGSLSITMGPEETVFDYTTDRCAVLDLPDVYAHPIRTAQGIMLVSGNAPNNYFMFGRDFSTLRRSCDAVLVSGDKWPVDSFDHQEWITSVYSEDGTTIHALVHNEYHDPYSRKCKPGITDPSNPCWYNFVSYAVSSDGGRTFTQPQSPNHLVAMLPFKWNADAAPRGAPPPHGYFEPSNIVKHQGFYYCMMFAITSNTNQGQRGTIIMRTDDITNPGSWKFWNGTDFSIPFVNPYARTIVDSSQFIPAFVAPRTIRDLRGSLTWNTYLNQFVLIGASVFPVDGTETCGFFLSRSSDLLTWSEPQLIRSAILGWPPCNRQTPDQAERNISQEAYPSLIDHDAADTSFTMVDSTAYLYYMQNMDNHRPGGWGLRRNLVRFPITFSKSDTASTHVDQGASATQALLLSIHPNPSTDVARATFSLLADSYVHIEILSALGTVVSTVLHDQFSAGTHTVALPLSALPAGAYRCRLTAGEAGMVTVPLIVVR